MPDAPGTRASLLVRLRDPKDTPAWNLFVDLYAPLIYGYYRKHQAQDADAVDLTQDVLARVSQGIRRFDYDPGRGTFRGWLFTVVRNRWLTWVSQRRLPQEEAKLDEQPAPDKDRAWEEDYRRHLFRWAIDQVRPNVSSDGWLAFQRTSIDGETAVDVAGELGLSVAAVYMAKSRVLGRLRETLREADGLGWEL